MRRKHPILLSFYALSNGRTSLFFGQLAYSLVNDLSFEKFGWKKTFRTIFNLYRIRTLADQEIEIVFDSGRVITRTDEYGAFKVTSEGITGRSALKSVQLLSGEKITILKSLYPLTIQTINASAIIISDIDDTLLHSFIRSKVRKFRTLVFTSVEKRRVVKDMMHLVKRFTQEGAASIYLSNSEQNLYPIIYRFLRYNDFPAGPLFLKKLRKLSDVALDRKRPEGNTHKLQTLREIIEIFPEKKLILIGDNTQSDLVIYLKVAKEFPDHIQQIIIRKVYTRQRDKLIIERSSGELKSHNINFYYEENFPRSFEL